MTMMILGGNQRKAEHIAREIMKDLTVSDIDALVADAPQAAEWDRKLCAACDETFPRNDARLDQIESELTKGLKGQLYKLFSEYQDLETNVSVARQKASFQLGWAAAMRLLRIDEKPSRKRKEAQPK